MSCGKCVDEIQDLKLTIKNLEFDLEVSRAACSAVREGAENWKQDFQRTNARLQRYRRAVKARLTTIAERVGQATAALQTRVEALEKENVALMRSLIHDTHVLRDGRSPK